ncbi:MAG: MobC family plasmid mobilization relaxosome protein [Clostridium sp.]|jgi:hypothetical protein|nr:MobC family plasmid mobilization relaxosome protein [Clostridium sp.]
MHDRSIEIKFRLNKKEAETLNERVKKSGISRESYLRHLINGLVPTDAPAPDYHAMMRELHGIGNNLNQIAQKAHVLNVMDVGRYDEAVKSLDRAVLDITNAAMLPRELTGTPQSPKALWGKEQPRSEQRRVL